MILSILDDFKFYAKAKLINSIIKKTPLKKYLEDLYISDGGPGFLESDFIKNFETRKISIYGPEKYKIKTFYKYNPSTNSSFIELAKISGLELIRKKTNISLRSSYGLGEAVKIAVKKDSKIIYIGFGASGVSDAGIGFLSALGVIFFDKNKREVNLLKQSWLSIKYIDIKSLKKVRRKYKKIKIIILSDVLLPLYGKKGSIFNFGLQKGIKNRDFEIYDNFLKNYFFTLQKNTKKKLKQKEYGSSGGIPLSICAVFKTQILNGTDYFIKKSKLKEIIKKNNITTILTGEGRLDHSSLFGKLPIQLSKFAKKNNLKIICIFGQIADQKLKKYFDQTYIIGKKNISLNKKFKIKNDKKKIIKISNQIYKKVL